MVTSATAVPPTLGRANAAFTAHNAKLADLRPLVREVVLPQAALRTSSATTSPGC